MNPLPRGPPLWGDATLYTLTLAWRGVVLTALKRGVVWVTLLRSMFACKWQPWSPMIILIHYIAANSLVNNLSILTLRRIVPYNFD